ncbi:MAG: NAD-binding protein [Pyrinomonadaceae bacterium]
MAKYTLREKFRYQFENTMSSGPFGVIQWLAVVSIVSVVVLGIVMVVLGISGSTEPDAEPLGFIEGSWKSLMATLDPGTMGADEGWDFRIVRFIATLIGIFLISILIGSISSGIDQKIEELKRGRSRVLDGDHTLILGWSPKIFTIITELIEANSNQKNPCIVILSEKDKVEAEEEINSRIEDFGNTKIVVRSGSTLESSSAEMVNINEARSIIVLSPEVANPDTYVIKTVLGVTNGKYRKPDAYHLVAEIKEERNLEAAELVGNNEAVYVLSEDLISRIIAQTCRQSGLSVVYTELLRFEGDEIYFEKLPAGLVGKTYRDSLFAYEDSCVIGVFTTASDVLLNPPMDRVLEADDSVIAISEDDDTVVANGRTEVSIDVGLFDRSDEGAPREENTLVLGWNDKGCRIVAELDNYVKEGSSVRVVAKDPAIAIQTNELQAELTNQTLEFRQGDIRDKKTLLSINTEIYDHIIVLSNRDIEVQESDAKTLISLLHLRNISDAKGVDYSIVTEMLDMRNRELGVVAKADDFVVSDNIISLMLSQLSENKELKKVYDVLFQAEGSEIYLKPVSRYVKPGTEADFYTVTASASDLGESAIGYRISSLSWDAEKQYGIKLNPVKSERVTFSENDYVIVLSED